MTLITDHYRDLNSQLHEQRADFGASGHRWQSNVRDLAQAIESADILDYGCGKGTLATACQDLNIRNYDPAIPEFAAEPDPADIVVCTDVLEHIEPEYVGEVLAHIAGLTRQIALLVVYMLPAKKSLPDGRNAHLSIHDGIWWFKETSKHFDVVRTNSKDGWFLMICRPKRKRMPALESVASKGQQSITQVDPILVAAVAAQCNAGGDMPGNALTNSGFQAMVHGDYALATQFFRRAIQMDSSNKYAWDNLASCFKQLGREDEAIAIYKKLIEADPGFIFAHNNYANSLLRRCEFRQGWQEYRWRLKSSRKSMEIVEPLTGRRLSAIEDPDTDEMRRKGVFIAREQGLGDELFFLRFVRPFTERHGITTAFYQPSEKLLPMLRRVRGLPVTIVENVRHRVPSSSCVVPLGELPRLSGHESTADIPPPIRATWTISGRRVPTVSRQPGRRLIGVTWEAGIEGAKHRGGLHKQISPAALGASLRGVDATFLVMQRNLRAADYDAFCRTLGRQQPYRQPHHDPALEIDLLLAQIAELDDYVGVSNTNMYLLQAIGRTARALIPFPPVWRWTVGPGESPWFPGFQTYREDVMGWDDALKKLRDDLLP